MRNKTKTDMVREFSLATGGSPPFELNSDFDKMKLKLVREEWDEVCDAVYNELHNDVYLDEYKATPEQLKENILKEMCDLVYVILGYAIYRGWDFDTAFNRVHASNMSKIPADGVIKRRADGKVLKPDTYKPANLGGLV
jgi:predicted HAD superfamily Cof-like phosphohydrolase